MRSRRSSDKSEEDETAEAGIWYKIFIDYSDESGKKDELLFYYYKTGQEPQEDLGPESDFESAPPTEAASGDGQPNPVDNDTSAFVPSATGPLVYAQNELPAQDSEPSPLPSTTRSSSLGISTAAALLAGLASQKRSVPQAAPPKTSGDADSTGFTRFDRLKRKVTQLLEES